jgi:HEPN domain-containing protein
LAEVVEKILKAELLRLGWFLVKTHDLEQLRGTLGGYGSDLMAKVRPLCEDLAEAYFADRYPGFDLEEPDWPKLRDQIRQVGVLADTVKARVIDNS